MNEIIKVRKQIYKILIIVVGIASIISFLVMEEPVSFILGIIFGSCISALNFQELGNTIIKSVDMNPEQAKSYSTRKYFIRYAITAIVLIVSLKATYINVLGTVIGLLLIKFLVLATNLFNDKDYYRNIVKRKEG